MHISAGRIIKLILVAALLGIMAIAPLALQGCGSDQAKQDFVDEVLSIMAQNQEKSSEMSQEGRAAFQAYYESGYNDLESAQGVADIYKETNVKDEESIQQLEDINKPDDQATEIVDTLQMGIETVDEGNTIYIEKLEKAPEQTVEERAQITNKSAEALGKYLEGITLVVDAFEMLLDYVQANDLEGADAIQAWLDKFNAEKEGIEQSLSAMEQAGQQQ